MLYFPCHQSIICLFHSFQLRKYNCVLRCIILDKRIPKQTHPFQKSIHTLRVSPPKKSFQPPQFSNSLSIHICSITTFTIVIILFFSREEEENAFSSTILNTKQKKMEKLFDLTEFVLWDKPNQIPINHSTIISKHFL